MDGQIDDFGLDWILCGDVSHYLGKGSLFRLRG